MKPQETNPARQARAPRSPALVVATPQGRVLWTNREARALVGGDTQRTDTRHADGLAAIFDRLEGAPALVGASSLRSTRLAAWRTPDGRRVACTLTPLSAPGNARALGAIISVEGAGRRGRQRGAPSAARRAGSGAAPALTPREAEVLELIASGAKTPGVARALGLSQRTVHAHVRSLFAKAGVTGRLALVARARESGLLR